MGKRRADGGPGSWRAAPVQLVVALFVSFSFGCGSERLDTFARSGSSGSGAGAAAGTDGGAGSAGAGGVATAGSGGAAGSVDMGAAAGAGGEPGPLVVEPLLTFEDFGQSFTVGPVNAERIAVEGQPFDQAWRASMAEPPENPWVAQLVMPLDKPVQPGQLLHISFWARCETPGVGGDCYTEYIFERASDPWEKSVTFPAHAGAEWAQKSEYFSAVEGYEAGAAHMVFRLGYEGQSIVLGGLELEAIARP